MAVQELQGKTLGEKHRLYNKLVKEAVESDKKFDAADLKAEDMDINNLLKIDIASQNRDVEFILKVLQCNDMLYVSRAIKRSTWLITDRQYSHIINPHHLHSQLFPNMMTKACNKLMLHIRLNLKDEKRVEEFYNYVKTKDTPAAMKWLIHCSLPFIEKEVEKNHEHINTELIKRLCEISITILEIYINHCDYKRNKLRKVMFLINTNADKYLDIIEKLSPYEIPQFGPKATEIIMKSCPQRIKDKFEKTYAHIIHLPTFAKYMKNEDIQDFLTKMSTNEDMKWWFKFENITHFVRFMPKEGRFDFLKKLFIEKTKNDDETHETQSDVMMCCSLKSAAVCRDACSPRSSANIYRWYRFAPFELAFPDITKLIRSESSPSERVAMFNVLLSCARRNPQHVHTILQYYSDKHVNEPFKFKIQFVNMVITLSDTHKFNEKSWNILNNLFHSMEVYTESDNNVQSCVEAIIVYKLLHNENVPEIIEKKFKFNSMKSIQTKLNKEEAPKLFNFLYNYLEKKLKDKRINSESEFTETVTLLEEIQSLMLDWKKELADYQWVLEKIKELIKLKVMHKWKADLSTLYLKIKPWRRAMFEESLLMYPSDKTCYNSLKHDPQLMSRHDSTVEELRRDDNVSLRRVLRSLRLYWPQSLAAEWANSYRARLEQPGGHKALVQGLCVLFPQNQVIDILKKYAPSDPKIKWGEDDELVLSLRKQFARNMYMSRPLPPADVILLYAKGDYLQFALPSLNAVLHNMSIAQTREHMTKVLDAPVSLQKHGIRFAFTKLESKELKQVFYEVWKRAKNPSIRAVLFEQTYNLLCRQTKPAMLEEIWELLSMFIDNLSTEENKIIYDTLGKVDKVPLLIRGKFVMKSLTFLKTLPAKANCESTITTMMYNMKDILDLVDPEFVANLLLEALDKQFTTERYEHVELLASYLLCSKNEEAQKEKYKKVLLPLLERAFAIWEVKLKGSYKASTNVAELLQELSKYFQRFVIEKKMVFPTKLFADIQDQLEKRLPIDKNYTTITTWKLITTYTKCLEEHKDFLNTIENENAEIKPDPFGYYDPKYESKWNHFYVKAIPKFSEMCLTLLREDIERFFPSIYSIFASCLENAFSNINQGVFLECLKALLKNEEFIASYMIVLQNTPKSMWAGNDGEEIVKEIREKLFSNPSAEIRLHYYNKYQRHDLEDTS